MKNSKLILLLILGLNAKCFAKELGVVAFPNNAQGALSPDKQFMIFSKDHERQELAHSLELSNKNSGQSRKILDYGRHVEVNWSLSSQAFYVNDYSGSDVANCFIVISSTNEKIDLSALIKAQESEKNALWSSHHKYLTCKSWAEGEVLVFLTGYGDVKPEGFEFRYKFNLNDKRFRRLVKP